MPHAPSCLRSPAAVDLLAKSLQQWGMKGSRESKGFEMIKVLAKMQERDIIYSRGCRPRTPASYPGAAAPGPPLLSQGCRPGPRYFLLTLFIR